MLAQRAIKFLDLNFLCISKVLLLDKEKISVRKLYSTANQNSNVIYTYICTDADQTAYQNRKFLKMLQVH